MAGKRVEIRERRTGAPVDPAEIAADRAGSVGHARRWAMAGQERYFERLAAEARRAIARRRSGRPGRAGGRGGADPPDGHDLSFYRGLALRYRDAASR